MSVNEELAAYAYAIPAVPTPTSMERHSLQFTNEENQHCQDAIYSEIIRVINWENCYQINNLIKFTEGMVEDTAKRNQSQETHRPNHQAHFTENDVLVNLRNLK